MLGDPDSVRLGGPHLQRIESRLMLGYLRAHAHTHTHTRTHVHTHTHTHTPQSGARRRTLQLLCVLAPGPGFLSEQDAGREPGVSQLFEGPCKYRKRGKNDTAPREEKKGAKWK